MANVKSPFQASVTEPLNVAVWKKGEIERLTRTAETQSQEVHELRQMAIHSQGSRQEERLMKDALGIALRTSENTVQQVVELNKAVVTAFTNMQKNPLVHKGMNADDERGSGAVVPREGLGPAVEVLPPPKSDPTSVGFVCPTVHDPNTGHCHQVVGGQAKSAGIHFPSCSGDTTGAFSQRPPAKMVGQMVPSLPCCFHDHHLQAASVLCPHCLSQQVLPPSRCYGHHVAQGLCSSPIDIFALLNLDPSQMTSQEGGNA